VARTPEGAELTQAHKQEQVRIRDAFVAEFLRAWPLLDFRRIDATTPGWLAVVMALVRSSRNESVSAAESYFDRYRQVEVPNVSSPAPRLRIVHAPDVTGTQLPSPAPDISPKIEARNQSSSSNRRRDNQPAHFGEFKPAVLDFGDKDPYVARALHSAGPAYAKHLTKRGEEERPARLKVLVSVTGSAAQQVLDGGRDAMEELIKADPASTRWARVLGSDNPCAFCAMLASRGPVYLREETAGFKAHPACACTPEPVYSSSADWPPGARDLRQLWLASTRGYSGQNAINAFRRAYTRQRKADEVSQPAALLA
jgi:hypothetical protein